MNYQYGGAQFTEVPWNPGLNLAKNIFVGDFEEFPTLIVQSNLKIVYH